MQLKSAHGRDRIRNRPIRSLWFVLVLFHTSTRCSSATSAVSTLVAEPKPDQGEGSSWALRLIEQTIRNKSSVTHSLKSSIHSLLWTSLRNTFWEGATSLPWPSVMSQKKGQQRGKTQATGSGAMSSSSKTEDPGYADVRDSFVPLFNGQPAEYRVAPTSPALLQEDDVGQESKASDVVLNIVGTWMVGLVAFWLAGWPT